MASAKIRAVLDEAIKAVISADPRIRIAFISVDGDEGYGTNFTRCFSAIKSCLLHTQFAECNLVDALTSLYPFWISDWLHLLKNARTRLFSGRICMNPLSKSFGASITELRRFFGHSPTFTDSTSLGKMRDGYPLDLFTLARAFHLRDQKSSPDLFIYVFVFGLWV
jgi:hypothetical protein